MRVVCWGRSVFMGPGCNTVADRAGLVGGAIESVLAQTFDHRAIDGAYSAAFLKEVRTVLETRDWVQALSS